MLENTTISITTIDDSYDEVPLYSNIRAEVQKRLYNIKDVLTNIAEDEENEKYYIILNKRYNKIRTWDLILFQDEFWRSKKVRITTYGMEKFISKTPFIEIKAEEFNNIEN